MKRDIPKCQHKFALPSCLSGAESVFMKCPFFPTHTAVENSLKVFDSHTALLLLG